MKKCGNIKQIAAVGTIALIVPCTAMAKGSKDDTIQINLDEVLVQVPYGTVKKEALTGAAAAIKAKDIENRPVASVTSALEGSMAGVYVNSSKGDPGDDPEIVIRGIGTVNGTTDPLYILDGSPYDGAISDLNASDVESITVLKDAAACALYGNRAANGVVLIETKKGKRDKLTVNFGMRFGSYTNYIPQYETLGAKDFMEVSWTDMRNERMASKNEDAATAGKYATEHLISESLKLNIFNKADDKLFTEDGKMVNGAEIRQGYADDLNWWDQLSRNGFRQEYNFNISQAREKYDYYVSLSHLGQNGYLKNSDFNRSNGNIRANFRPVKWFEGGLTFNAATSKQTTGYDSSVSTGNYDTSNAFYICRVMAPIYPVHLHNSDGTYMYNTAGEMMFDTGSYTDAEGKSIITRPVHSNYNIVRESEVNSFSTLHKRLNGSAYVKFKFLKDFSVTARGNINHFTSNNVAYFDPELGSGKGYEGALRNRDYSYTIYDFQQQLDWRHNFDKHGVEAMIGHESYDKKYTYQILTKAKMTVPGIKEMDNFETVQEDRGYYMQYRTESYFARARYNYDNRYHFMASYRRDGSSRFSKDNRWGDFYSVGASWVLSNEKFMKNAKWVNMLKLRADYGTTGNDAALGYYDYYSLYTSAFNMAGNQAVIFSQWSDANLHWEVGKSFGVALETRLFNRWNLTAEYFYRRNQDLLFDVAMPSSMGGTSAKDFSSNVNTNIGTIDNKGLEITTDVDIVKTKNWRFNLALNLTHVQNKVELMPDQDKNGIAYGDIYRVEEGKSMYSFYLPQFAGVDQLTGLSMYTANLDDYCVKNSDDVVLAGNAEGADLAKYVTLINGEYYVNNTTYAKKDYCGSALPKFYGSFKPTVSWKGITVSALFTFALGGKVYDHVYRELMSTESGSPHNYHKDILNSWTAAPEGMTEESADRLLADGIPVINSQYSDYNNAVSSRFLISGDYLTMKNLTIGYSLPAPLLYKMGIQGMSFSLTCENLFTLSARKGLDPQQAVYGYYMYKSAAPRIFTIGFDMKF